ncbi:hypothetical protein C2G38_2041621 [Gigaspora rosea]|uniref:BED-type domain-containing protein n=1 Tax=Gigaspora rosea TaxID=44941 RepID=A0A397UU34_9GLOM|nr:hypothetical protein C2G38_2041621 [Gigaspora rosea]
MAGNNGNQGLIQISDSNNKNNLLVIENSDAQQSSLSFENNDRSSICWKYFEPSKPKRGEKTKCTIEGCNTKYIWRGSTTNLVGHLKNKHGITPITAVQPSLLTNNENFELKVNQLIKFIVHTTLPFNIVDNLKLFGLLDNQQITSSIIQKQIFKGYDSLFSQMKSKIQHAKSVMLSVNLRRINDKPYIIITYDGLTEDFKFHKILMYVNYFSPEGDILIDDILSALVKWELTNLMFIRCNPIDYGNFKVANTVYNDVLKEKNEDIIICVSGGSGDDLISHCLKRCAEECADAQVLSSVVEFLSLCDVKDRCTLNCNYHKIEFLTLIEQPEQPVELSNNNYYDYNADFLDNNQYVLDNNLNDNVLDNNYNDNFLIKLPFSIFSKLLRLFKPLEHIKIVTMRDIREMIVNASNIFTEISRSSLDMIPQYHLEHKVLESFLRFLIYSYLDLHQRVGLFLDPHSKSIFINDLQVKRHVLNKCQDYYSEIANSPPGINSIKSIQDLANEELEHYINLQQLSYNENDLCKWWQNSKHIFPGLATLAVKYLPLLKLNADVPLENLDKFIDAYGDGDTVNKVAFLQYNMKYIDL